MWILRNKLQIARPTETVRASSVRLQGIESFQSSWREREREREMLRCIDPQCNCTAVKHQFSLLLLPLPLLLYSLLLLLLLVLLFKKKIPLRIGRARNKVQ